MTKEIPRRDVFIGHLQVEDDTPAIVKLFWDEALVQEKTGLLTLTPEIREDITRTLSQLSSLTNPDHQKYNGPLYHSQVLTPSRWLTELYSFVIAETIRSPDAFPIRTWLNMIIEADILKFKSEHLRNMQTDITDWLDDENQASLALYPPCCKSVFISRDVNPEMIREVLNQYQRSFNKTIDFLKDYPQLFSEAMARDYWKCRKFTDFDNKSTNSNNTTPDGTNHIYSREYMQKFSIGCIMFLNEEDYQKCYVSQARSFKKSRRWVDDATLADALVITPEGAKNLFHSPKLESNSLHEIIHYMMYKFSFTPYSDISSQYLFPFWLKEGLANILLEVRRGRDSSDAFHESQKKYFTENKDKTADEIMSDPHANYLDYQLLAFYLFAACDSARQGYTHIQFPSFADQPEVFTKLFGLINSAFSEINSWRSGTDYPNQIAEAMFEIFFEEYGANGWQNITFSTLKAHFDANFRRIGEIYFGQNDIEAASQIPIDIPAIPLQKNGIPESHIPSYDLLPYDDAEIAHELVNGSEISALLMMIENMTYEKTPNWMMLPADIRTGVRRALLDLSDIVKFCIIPDVTNYSEVSKEMLLDNAVTLICYFHKFIQKKQIENNPFPLNLWLSVIADTSVLSFLKVRAPSIQPGMQFIKDIVGAELTGITLFASSVYISEGIDRQDAANIIRQLQISHIDNTTEMHASPEFWRSLQQIESVMDTRPLTWQDVPLYEALHNDPATSLSSDEFLDHIRVSMMWGTIFILDQSDYDMMFYPCIRNHWPNLLVRDATLADSLVFTPKGVQDFTSIDHTQLRPRSNANQVFYNKLLSKLFGLPTYNL